MTVKKQGKWIAQSIFDEADNFGFAHYNQDVLDGPYEIYALDYGSSTEGAKQLMEKGIYRNGVKDGEWLEQDGTKGRYEQGVKQGPWTEKISVGHYRDSLGQGSYLGGETHWPLAVYFLLGGSKAEVSYLNGLRQGEAKSFNKDNVLLVTSHYEQGWLDGQSIWYSSPNVVSSISNYRHGELDGPQMHFDTKGELTGLMSFKLNETVTLKPSQDECIMRKNPYAADCAGIINQKKY